MAVVTSLLDDSTQIINLNETICHGKYAPRLLERNNSNCYLLPSIYSKNNALSRQIEIIPLFVRACQDAMFKIGGCYEKDCLAIVFECICSTLNNHEENQHKTLRYRQNKGLKKPHEPPLAKTRKTQRPPKMESNDVSNHLFISPCDLHIYGHFLIYPSQK